MRKRLEEFDANRDRRNPIRAEELFKLLWPNRNVRTACAQRLARSIRCAHELASASWEVTMFDWGIRLNVGQVCVLQFDSDEFQACRWSPHGKSDYSAVENARWFRGRVVRIAAAGHSRTWKAHERLIGVAAEAKKVSPWKRRFSEGILKHVENLLHINLPRPAYCSRSESNNGKPTLHSVCAYTIVNGDVLERHWRQGRSFSFIEGKRWKQIANEHAQSEKAGSIVPILFADARATANVIFKGVIEKIHLSQRRSKTTVYVRNLEKLRRPVPKTRLVISSSGRPILRSHIRSYVVCQTPRWLYSVAVLPGPLPEIVDMSRTGAEGRRRLVSHLRIERNHALVELKKRSVLSATGGLSCEVCSFDFNVYGALGSGFCEVHHRRPLSEATSEVHTSLSDLAVICSNCHRMVHRGGESRPLSRVRASLKLKR